MWTSRLPKTVCRWADKNPHIVSNIEVEEDERGARHHGPYSVWVYLKPGWINTLTDCHFIHEATAKYALEVADWIEPCSCDDCLSIIELGLYPCD